MDFYRKNKKIMIIIIYCLILWNLMTILFIINSIIIILNNKMHKIKNKKWLQLIANLTKTKRMMNKLINEYNLLLINIIN